MALGALTLLSAMSGRGAPEPFIGTLDRQDMRGLKQVCECEFYRGPIDGTTTVLATWEQRRRALVRIAGQLTRFEFEEARGEALCHLNEKLRQRWKAKDATVVLELTVEQRGEEACWYRGIMRLTAGMRMETLDITGSCGC